MSQQKPNTRPVTLHINTGKGTAVVQVQSSQASQLSAKVFGQPSHTLPTSTLRFGGVGSSITGGGPSSSLIGHQPLTGSAGRVFPSSIALPLSSTNLQTGSVGTVQPPTHHPMPGGAGGAVNLFFNPQAAEAAAAQAAVAAAAYHHDLAAVLQRNVAAAVAAAAAAKSATPSAAATFLGAAASSALYNAAAAKYFSGSLTPAFSTTDLQQQSRLASLSGALAGKIPSSSLLGPNPFFVGTMSNVTSGSSAVQPSEQQQCGASFISTQPQGHLAAQGQSPRPSILRKRTAGGVCVENSFSGSPAAKRLVYDSPTSANSSMSSVTSGTSQQISMHSAQILSNISSSAAMQRPAMTPIQQFPSTFADRVSCIREATTVKDANTINLIVPNQLSVNRTPESATFAESQQLTPQSDISSVVASSAQASQQSQLPTMSIVGQQPSPRKRERKQRLDDLPREPILPRPPDLEAIRKRDQVIIAAAARAIQRHAAATATMTRTVTVTTSVDDTTIRRGDADTSACSKSRRRAVIRNKMQSLPTGSSTTTSLTTTTASGTVSDESSQTSTTATAASSSVDDIRSNFLNGGRGTIVGGRRRSLLKLWSRGDDESDRWHARRWHFKRRSDVKPIVSAQSSAAKSGDFSHNVSNQKVPQSSLNFLQDLCQQKRVSKRLDNWRLSLLAENFDDLAYCQAANKLDLQTLADDLQALLGHLSSCATSDVSSQIQLSDSDEDTKTLSSFDEGAMTKVKGTDEEHRNLTEIGIEMALTSFQRCTAIRRRLAEARTHLGVIWNHKKNADEIILKYSSKRPNRKKGGIVR